jgi:hypothetical protein
MYDDQSSPTLINVSLSGNTAASLGGGMYNVGGSPTLINVSLSGNSAGDRGGGMANEVSDLIRITNSILWGNSGPSDAQMYNLGSTPRIGCSDIQDSRGSGPGWDASLGIDGGGNLDTDPLFVDAAGVDGIPGTPDDDLRLQPTSPAVDAGDNAAVPITVTLDLAGNPRCVDIPEVPDTGAGTPPIVDMGAYEVQEMTEFEVYLPAILRNKR